MFQVLKHERENQQHNADKQQDCVHRFLELAFGCLGGHDLRGWIEYKVGVVSFHVCRVVSADERPDHDISKHFVVN